MHVVVRDSLTSYPKTMDALNGQLLLDNVTSEKMSRMDSHLGVMDLNRPFCVSRNIALATSALSTIGSWIIDGDKVSVPMEG
jgi:hypothetical protein